MLGHRLTAAYGCASVRAAIRACSSRSHTAWPATALSCHRWQSRAVRAVGSAAEHTGAKSKLILYSKPGCCLCDGLKEKIEALTARAQFVPSMLTNLELEVRDITTSPEWERAYGLVIPVLTCADADGSNEVKVPRQSPRMSTERLGAVLEQALAREAG